MPLAGFRAPAFRQRGRSLVELIVSIALGALMLTMMATSVLALAVGEQNSTAAAGLVSSIERARAEAALRRVPVGVCGIRAQDSELAADQLRCADDAWSGGWMTFVDGNNNQRLDDGEPVLQVQRTRRVQVLMVGTEAGATVGFRPTGTLAHATSMRLAVHGAGGADQNARAVCVSVDGFVHLVSAQMPCR